MTERSWKSRLKSIQSDISSALLPVGAFCQDLWRRSRLSEDWSGTGETLGVYWRVYGGRRALIRSPALIFSVFASLLCYPLWWSERSSALVLSVVPNLLGFSIGAMAVVLAFPTTTVFNIITEDGREDSYYLDLVTKFVHFVFVQVSALMFALFAMASSFFLFSYLALLGLFYAVATGAMTAIALFEVAIFYNSSQSNPED